MSQSRGPVHRREIAAEELRLAVHAYDGADYLTPAGEPARVRLTLGRVESVISEMKPAISRRDFFAAAPPGINCASGFIRFGPDGTARLEPHHPDQRRRHLLRSRWAPDTPFELPPDSLLGRLLCGCFRGDKDAWVKIDPLAEVVGVAALGYGPRLRQPKAVILHGAAAESGKSQFLNLLRALLPADAATSISPRHFADGRYVVKLAGKLLNALDEPGGGVIASRRSSRKP